MLDIGLGNGLRNKLATAIALDDFVLAKKYISSAYVALSFYIFTFLLFFLLISNFIPWDVVLNAPSSLDSELNILVKVVFISFGLNFILKLLSSILNALQSPAISSLIATLGQLLSLINVAISIYFFNIKSLLILGSIVSLTPIIVLFFATLILFKGKYKILSPNIKYYDKSLIKGIVGLGLNFFIIQMMTIFLYQSNNIIITHIVGNSGVVEYNIANKYVQIINVLYLIIVTPLWSATTQAYVKGEFNWIKSMNKKLNKIALLFSILGILMLLLSPFVYNIWLNNNKININFSYTFILLLSEIFRMYYGNYGYIINGIGKLHAQLIISIIMAILYIPIAVISGKTLGLTGILLSSMMVNLINSIWSRYQFNVIINNKPSKFWNR